MCMRDVFKSFCNEYNLLDVIRYNVGLSHSQTVLLEKDLKNPLPTKLHSMQQKHILIR
ncbi:hydrolase, alpha/beta fold family [Bacillus thuringiensis serovar kurstaki str. HD-1]|nr:hypothetical protein HD73_2611 [Bacillus thuringiensis serovar kurstaki str. HD73]KEH45453.1 hydrolase, alpha/beta fold family [Bacillus thuringiensis serovar kurstaki str. HD-1]KLA12696.1 hypothetical protein B4158_2301 [Bacillus cereus]